MKIRIRRLRYPQLDTPRLNYFKYIGYVSTRHMLAGHLFGFVWLISFTVPHRWTKVEEQDDDLPS